MNLADAETLRRETASVLLPPNRNSVADEIEKFVWTHTPGGHSALFKVPPYMRRPVNLVNSRRYQGIVFVGPAQCLKTFSLVESLICYNVKHIHADMLVINTTETVQRDFSATRLKRLLRYSYGMQDLVTKDNVLTKEFRNGETLFLGHPAISQLSGKTLRFVIMTDYDRFPKDVDGEGSAWQAAFNRIKAFLSRGTCIAESSPKGYSTDPKAKPLSDHHYPPAEGITGLYHQGTMERWYWPCPQCGEYFQSRPSFDENYIYIPPHISDLSEAAQKTRLICPNHGCEVDIHRFRSKMNERGDWVALGQEIDSKGEIHGEPPETDIASFGLSGFAAALQPPKTLILKYLQAKRAFEESGDDTELMTVINTQLGSVMVGMKVGTGTLREALIERARNSDLPKMQVPPEVRFLTARIDVQAGKIGKKRFVVQVHGHGPDRQEWVIDRFNIRKTDERLDENGEPVAIEPGAYPEDWDEITSQVLNKAYPLQSGKGYMRVIKTVCDYGGEEGVSDNALSYCRRLKTQGLSKRFHLVKGGSNRNAEIFQISMPDAQAGDKMKKAKNKGSRGDIPVAMLNTDKCKDAVYNRLQRHEIGKGYMFFPPHLGEWFFAELTYEERDVKGHWSKPGKGNNEAFDLCGYGEAALRLLKAHQDSFWLRPPAWALPQDENSEVFESEDNAQMNAARPKKRRRKVRYSTGG